MCDNCGCENDNNVRITHIDEENRNHIHTQGHHNSPNSHTHDHNHDHKHDHGRRINLQTDILSRNNLLAERNRGYFEAKKIFCLNLMSSPGSGKTLLLERTIKELIQQKPLAVIEGDQQTLNDAERIRTAGAPAVQVNTGNGCHLDSSMIYEAINKLKPVNGSILFVENVGNLVCPSLFDLGENKRVVIISTTEGEDKPIKYPTMFESADLCVINKTDLLPYVDFSIENAKDYALKVNHHLEFIELSAKTGDGLGSWIDWLVNNSKQTE